MGKKLVSFYEDDKGVTIHCADNTRYTGDILVGADGTYSTVRDHLYRTLKAKAQLPASDDTPLPFSCTCLVGQTVPLDPKEFPGANMEQEHSEFNFVIGKEEQYSVCTEDTGWFAVLSLTNEKIYRLLTTFSSPPPFFVFSGQHLQQKTTPSVGSLRSTWTRTQLPPMPRAKTLVGDPAQPKLCAIKSVTCKCRSHATVET